MKKSDAELVEKLERPKKESKFATVTEDELDQMPDEHDDSFEDTDDFGADLEDE